MEFDKLEVGYHVVFRFDKYYLIKVRENGMEHDKWAYDKMMEQLVESYDGKIQSVGANIGNVVFSKLEAGQVFLDEIIYPMQLAEKMSAWGDTRGAF